MNEMDDMVDKAFQELLDCYLASNHRNKVEVITKAFNFARQAHAGVKRLSGEPYIMHPISVAMIACKEMGLGSTSISAALLHDVVEDTEYTVEDMENLFGKKIALIIDGLTKISGGIFGEQASAQAENFKKLLLTMSEDIRVILIKISDRLHNMRTLASQPANKQYKIAGETLYIYAPLADRLGLSVIKDELEDLSFRYEHPEEYADIQSKLAATKAIRDQLYAQFVGPIQEALDKMQVQYTIKARIKTPYSIWHKMQVKRVTFDDIYDILAVRIIFKPTSYETEINECFGIYIALCKLYQSHPDRLRDWLSHPKANGYQALHVTLMSNIGQWVEVQIRSERMNEIAEKGFAAHWKYKHSPTLGTLSSSIPSSLPPSSSVPSGNFPEDAERDAELDKWLQTIKEILDDPQPDALDFLDAIKLNLFASEIFVFTPKGEIITMPVGCTALDFAFQIHTLLGSHCIGAKVNHRLVPISHKLQSGDQVEILSSNSQHCQESWLNFVSTAKARNKIVAILRKEKRDLKKKGEQQLEEFLHKHEMQTNTAIVNRLCELHEEENSDNLFTAIGNKKIILSDTDIQAILGNSDGITKRSWKNLVPFIRKKDNTPQKHLTAIQDKGLIVVESNFNKKKPVYITDHNINQFIFPKCCHVIPGDDTIGFIDRQHHIVIHHRNCHVANKLKASYGNRILDIKWDMQRQHHFLAAIEIRGIDHVGMFKNITTIIADKMNVNITAVQITVKDNIFQGTIEMHVFDRSDVKAIITAITQLQGIQEVKQTI
ncbi:MAG: bifunctional (p)ppGpp synthetase/guanosine-3',5'-bis(diphosphate) 3'-pyrophosphohydrolase [Bacteroidaceae bacterium]|nr:bifunctional (p)ppGpp synthetase/guanosine-3',5'-bis(diphosphate) 3'-pyrophosphohydrolase [Bacteroidaceae bacterium]